MILYYCCTHKNNNCPNKEKCMRYLNAETEPHATLYKYACKKENGYQLFIEKEEVTDLTTRNEGESSSDTTKNEGVKNDKNNCGRE